MTVRGIGAGDHDLQALVELMGGASVLTVVGNGTTSGLRSCRAACERTKRGLGCDSRARLVLFRAPEAGRWFKDAGNGKFNTRLSSPEERRPPTKMATVSFAYGCRWRDEGIRWRSPGALKGGHPCISLFLSAR